MEGGKRLVKMEVTERKKRPPHHKREEQVMMYLFSWSLQPLLLQTLPPQKDVKCPGSHPLTQAKDNTYRIFKCPLLYIVSVILSAPIPCLTSGGLKLPQGS